MNDKKRPSKNKKKNLLAKLNKVEGCAFYFIYACFYRFGK